jgi:hypothetical protein
VLSISLFGICSVTTEIDFCLLRCAADLFYVGLFLFSWVLPSPQILALVIYPAQGLRLTLDWSLLLIFGSVPPTPVSWFCLQLPPAARRSGLVSRSLSTPPGLPWLVSPPPASFHSRPPFSHPCTLLDLAPMRQVMPLLP